MGSVTRRHRSHDEFTLHASNTSPEKEDNTTELDSFDVDSIRKEVSRWRQFVDLFFGCSLTKDESFRIICGLCLAQPGNEYELRRFRKVGYLRLSTLVRTLNRRELHHLDVRLLVWCCLSLVSHYEDRYLNSTGCTSYRERRHLRRSKDLLCTVLDMEIPEREGKVVRSCVSYLTATRQWDFEDVVLFVFQHLLSLATKQEIVLTKLIKAIEVCQRDGDVDQAYMITASLALVMENLYPDVYQFTLTLHKCFSTLLKMYILNDMDETPNMLPWKLKFHIQIKNTIKNFISKIRDRKGLITSMDTMVEVMLDPEIPDEEQVDLTEMMVLCAQKLPHSLYHENISPLVLKFLLSYLKSDRRSSAMGSQRIFHYLLDRRRNLEYFTEPIYHFKGRSNFAVNTDYSREDVQFFKSFSREFFAGIYGCLNRFTEMANLVSSYTTICLVLVEVPDPVTTISVIHAVIKTQENFLKTPDKSSPITHYHVNAIVASILSLICLIHGDEVEALDKYVQEVVSYRNQNSPHLLPPLSPQYNIAKHHTTEYHNQLYFLEEEVLYALKQCWLEKRRTN